MTAYHPTGQDDSLHHAPRAGEDEWGLFDPERHGIAAVRARLGVTPPAPESTADAAARRRQSPRLFVDEE